MDKKLGYSIAEQRMAELGLYLTLGPNGEVLVIKRRVGRGASETLYKWDGKQPQQVLPPIKEMH